MTSQIAVERYFEIRQYSILLHDDLILEKSRLLKRACFLFNFIHIYRTYCFLSTMGPLQKYSRKLKEYEQSISLNQISEYC